MRIIIMMQHVFHNLQGQRFVSSNKKRFIKVLFIIANSEINSNGIFIWLMCVISFIPPASKDLLCQTTPRWVIIVDPFSVSHIKVWENTSYDATPVEAKKTQILTNCLIIDIFLLTRNILGCIS